MIQRDQHLLARLAHVQHQLDPAVAELMAHRHTGTLPPDTLRALGELLGGMSADLYARAAEIDGRIAEPPSRVIIDARTEGI